MNKFISTVGLVFRKFRKVWLVIGALVLLMALTRLTALNQYLIVDEADRWHWAEDFVRALNRGDLAGTLVGDGYPGIVPVWGESIWILLEAGRRSLIEGQWIGEIGLNHLLHEWDRTAMLYQQRLPIVLLNTLIALAIVWTIWRIFGRQVALMSGLLITLDPFYLSDSRVNRAEAVITGLMTLSVLFLILYYQRRRFHYIIISGIFGGLSFLTKIQALTILPIVALTGLLIYVSYVRESGSAGDDQENLSSSSLSGSLLSGLVWLLKFGGSWALAACLTWLLLWPSMWVAPLETLTLVFNYTTRKVGAEGINLFFWGQTFQNADPGFLFYPVVFFLRITPLVLFGLVGAILRFIQYGLPPLLGKTKRQPPPGDPFGVKGSSILVLFVLLYAAIMTAGSHKQDRYLMPVFLSVDILGAMGLVYIWVWLKYGILATLQNKTLRIIELSLLAGLVIIQAATVLPHHPYYYSYFNPLFGGGQTAVQTLRIGWGEGMDLVGAYLGAKPDSENLVVSTRFGHNMLGFKGEIDSLGPGGSWTRADYVVLYIQQVQRRLDPSPGFIDYFQARTPEKVITLGGLEYAWIHQIPFTVPADPQVSRIAEQAALLGYRWEVDHETGQSTLRLYWENLGLTDSRQLVNRLVGSTAETEWAVCLPDPDFVTQAMTPGAYVESLCTPPLAALPPNRYTVEFGLTSPTSNTEEMVPILFPQGWQAAQIATTGKISDTPDIERLNAIAEQRMPLDTIWLDRVYDGDIRLLGYQINPTEPVPGDTVVLTLYWQATGEQSTPNHLVVQLADSRGISLGRFDGMLPQQERERWLPGEINVTRHQFPLSSELDAPLGGRIEVSLVNEAKIPLQPTNLTGEQLDPVIDHLTIAPHTWPALDEAIVVDTIWQTDQPETEIALRGYLVSASQTTPGESLFVTLFWEMNQPVNQNYMVFVHLLDESGQIIAQDDSLPRAGAYPTSWWLPGQLVEDTHSIALPQNLPGGIHQMVVGLYGAESGERLLMAGGSDSSVLTHIDIQ